MLSANSLPCVYVATCQETGKSYIGATIDFANRRRQHVYNALRMHGPSTFARAIRKHGKDSFSWITMLVFVKQLARVEKLMIEVYGTLEPGGYNELPKGKRERTRAAVAREKRREELFDSMLASGYTRAQAERKLRSIPN